MGNIWMRYFKKSLLAGFVVDSFAHFTSYGDDTVSGMFDILLQYILSLQTVAGCSW